AEDDVDARGVDEALPSLEALEDAPARGFARRRSDEARDARVGLAQEIGEDERAIEARGAGEEHAREGRARLRAARSDRGIEDGVARERRFDARRLGELHARGAEALRGEEDLSANGPPEAVPEDRRGTDRGEGRAADAREGVEHPDLAAQDLGRDGGHV